MDFSKCTLNKYIQAERTDKYIASSMKKKYTDAVTLFLPNKKIDKKINVHFNWYKNNNRQDHDNIAFCKKYILDAMVKRGMLPSDSPRWVGDFQDTFYRGDRNYLYCEIEVTKEVNKGLFDKIIDCFIDWMQSDDCYIVDENGNRLPNAKIEGNVVKYFKKILTKFS